NSLITQAELAVTLAMLGRKDEAARQFATYDASMRERGRLGSANQLRFHAAMGDAKRFVEAVRDARKTSMIWVADPVLAHDPWYDGMRSRPEFKALSQELSIAASRSPR